MKMDKQGLYWGPQLPSAPCYQHTPSPRPLTRFIPPRTVSHAASTIPVGLSGALALGIGGAGLHGAGVKRLQHQQTRSGEGWAAADQREAW